MLKRAITGNGCLAVLAILPAFAPAAAPLQAQPVTALEARVDRIVERDPFRRGHWGIAVTDAATGEVLFGRNEDRLFIPASNTKLVVAAAAAHYLPPDFRYRTTLYATGPVEEGVLRGDLVVYGRGDPTISGRYEEHMLAIWEALADSLHARGVRRISGGVVADESHWDTDYVRGDWETYDLLWWYAAPVAALGFNDNSIDFSVAPGSPGRPARITWKPETSFFTFVNRTATVAAGRAKTLDFTRIPGTDTIVAYGEIPADAARRTEYFAVDDPARYAATVFHETLERNGIEVGGHPGRVLRDAAASRAAGPRTVLVEHRSVPLARLIAPVLQTSQNWFAEQLLKTIGREVGGEGSWSKGLELERRFLIDVVGLDSAAFRLRDASGLSTGNLMTPRALATLLGYIGAEPSMRAALDALPVSAARTGSLRLRLQDLGGRVTAKTGSISNVDSLSGFLTTDSGRRVIFAIIVNNSGQSSTRMRGVLDDLVRALARTL